MYSNTRFCELLKDLPKGIFHQEVDRLQTDRYAKSLKSWDLLVTMIYGQVQQVPSLRTLVSGFNTHTSHHYHLNSQEIKRSTLSDALAKRSSAPFRAACEALMTQVGRQQRRSLKDMICLLDSTSITLRGPGFDEWTQAHRTRITQGLKIHVAMDAHQKAPTYANITHANVNDLTDAQRMEIVPNTIYVFDKGYCDYNWWHDIDQAGAGFVTRLKKNANTNLIETRKVAADQTNILSDTLVQFGKKHLHGKRKNHYLNKTVRRIEVLREGKEKPLILVTNDLTRSASDIADLYKQRWQIELLFKWLKQKLKLKRYFGYSENAVRIQIYSALITYLLMTLYHQSSGFSGTLSNLAIILAHGLFHRPETDRFLYQRRRSREKEFLDRQGTLIC